MKLAIDLAVRNVRSGVGGPFGAVIVRDGKVIATGVNQVTSTNDPSAHAEIMAIRAACQLEANFQLEECELYSSCEPCPMCLGAVYWARLKAFYFACNRHNAAQAGFDDAFIYDQLPIVPEERSIPGIEICPEIALQPFEEWARSLKKVDY